MKKLLSILGAVGLTATAASSVVACSSKLENNPTSSYKDFQSWITQSKDNNENALIFIGGKTDSDSLSFLAAKQSYATSDDNYDINHLIDSKNIKNVDAGFTATALKDNNMTSAMTNSFSPSTAGIPANMNVNNTELGTRLLGKENKNTQNRLAMHSILVDDIATFWTTGLGTKIIDGIVNDQAKDFTTWNISTNKKEITQDNIDKAVKATQKSIKTALTSTDNKGPYFLEIRNGNIVGITTGYKNYRQLSTDDAVRANPQAWLDKNMAKTDINTLVLALVNNTWTQEFSYIQDNWTKEANKDSLIMKNSSFASLTSSWNGLADKNTKITASDQTSTGAEDSSSSTNSGTNKSNNGSTTANAQTKAFVYNNDLIKKHS